MISVILLLSHAGNENLYSPIIVVAVATKIKSKLNKLTIT